MPDPRIDEAILGTEGDLELAMACLSDLGREHDDPQAAFFLAYQVLAQLVGCIRTNSLRISQQAAQIRQLNATCADLEGQVRALHVEIADPTLA